MEPGKGMDPQERMTPPEDGDPAADSAVFEHERKKTMQKSMELHFEVRQTPDGDETRPYAVLALALNVPERFTVPEESGGVPVRGFGDFLRYEDARLREVHFPKKLRPAEFSVLFKRQTVLEKVTLPEVEALPDSVFEKCFSLTEVNFPETLKRIGAYAFAECSSLREVVIPEGVEAIECRAFCGCSSLRKVKLPATLKHIGAGIFDACPELRVIQIAKENPYFRTVEGMLISSDGSSLYCYPAALPDTVCNLTRVPGLEGLNRIEPCAFSSARFLKTLILPETLHLLGFQAFAYCSALETVELPETCTHVETQLFHWCSALREIQIPEGWHFLPAKTFQDCAALETAEFLGSLNSIQDEAFEGCKALKTIHFPHGLIEVRGEAFSGCSSLEKVEFPAGLELLEPFAFAGCTALREVIFRDGFPRLRPNVFRGCNALREIICGMECGIHTANAFGKRKSVLTLTAPKEEVREE